MRTLSRVVSRAILVALALAPALTARAGAQATPATATAPADSIDPAKRQLLRELLAQSHAVDLMLQSMEAGMPAQRAANPMIPAEFWDRFAAAARDRRPELEEMFVQIYARHFDVDDLRGLVAFNRTPLGQKLLAMQPVIAREAIEAGRQWGQRLGVEIGRQIATEQAKRPNQAP